MGLSFATELCRPFFVPVHRLWSNAGLPGELARVLPSPKHFEQASRLVTRESTAESVVAGPKIEAHVEQLRSFVEAGYDEGYLANMGPLPRDDRQLRPGSASRTPCPS